MEYLNRVIPVLTLTGGDKLVKTVGFKKPNYIGDPINAVKIFNEKMVDEIVLLDISATTERREPNYAKIEEICSEAFMPFAYGGGIKTMDQVKTLFGLGIEKVVLNSALLDSPELVKKIYEIYGSQSIIASVDVRKSLLGGYKAYVHSGRKKVKMKFNQYIEFVKELNVGELFITSIDLDGTYKGYDIELVKMASKKVDIPLIICGGAKNMTDFKMAIKAGASAVAAGSFFVYKQPHQAVLISYPPKDQLKSKVFL